MSFYAAALKLAIAEPERDPWDDRTPEQIAAYEAEVERLAELARDVPFGDDER